MNTLKAIATTLLLFITATIFAQSKTEKINVSGNCGMCAKKIEAAAKDAGAGEAKWNQKKKVLTVTYDAAATSGDAIQKKVADAGYDTEKYTGSMEAYNNLHDCCKYDNKRK